MQFAALQDLLKKKKRDAAASSPVTPPPLPSSLTETAIADATQVPVVPSSSSTSSASAAPPLPTPSPTAVPAGTAVPYETTSEDPYAAALRSATRANAPLPTASEPPLGGPTEASTSSTGDSSPGAKRPRSPADETAVASSDGATDDAPSAAPPSAPPLLSRDAFEAEKERLLAALTACMRATSEAMKQRESLHPTTARGATRKDSAVAPSTAPLRHGVTIPAAVQRCLRVHYVTCETPPEDAADQQTSLPCPELKALLAPHDDDTGATPRAEQTSAPPPLRDEEPLTPLVHALWYLTCAYWRAAMGSPNLPATALTSAASPSTPEELLQKEFGAVNGWCYAVYLHANHRAPDSLRFSSGRAIATALDAWQEAWRTVTSALELLAYLLYDLEQLQGSRETATPGCAAAADVCVVPKEIREGLHEMIVTHLQRERDFAAARQCYTDLTMGTANWRLGLFSGGEVHMRRALERIERNRIFHVLNNERALRLLHATRELVAFAERQLRSPPLSEKAPSRDSVVSQFPLP